MADAIRFVKEMAFEYGVVQQVSPLVRRVVARNPSPFTFHGTGTYIVGRGPITKIMPSDGRKGGTIALVVGRRYNFHEF